MQVTRFDPVAIAVIPHPLPVEGPPRGPLRGVFTGRVLILRGTYGPALCRCMPTEAKTSYWKTWTDENQ
jgi:hypothetical protein